ncbi:stalk domain-containing protein [Paenibacillus paeoniae]|uniref:Copper amine oxidase-like N-terminal domain-containing protein n=1 Tax=Paenibacillus paeoniae TaxID=2292705 RepID=A0A371P5P2_9BACL|nr:stalk domain-containing protein [Paenibacillus paeoniae]REK71195.1 hypothetical protein DX130_22380 [Paenibacillus paeoniae]
MRKFAAMMLSLFLLVSLIPTAGAAQTETKASQIADVKGDMILMEDGTLWLKRPWAATGYMKASIDATSFGKPYGYALTSKGELISWDDHDLPTVDKSQNSIKYLAYGAYIKKDGTVWYYDGKQIEGLKNIVLYERDYMSHVYLTTSGEIYHSYIRDAVLDKVEDPYSIVSLLMTSDNDVAYMDNTGKVVVVKAHHYDYNDGKVTFRPKVLTNDAAHIQYNSDNALVVTKKDGTVWMSGSYKDQDKLVKQVKGIEKAVKAVPYYGTLHETKKVDDPNNTITVKSSGITMLVKHQDGSWKVHVGDKVTNIKAPESTGIKFTTSNAQPAVGNTIYFKVVQQYNNGYKETLSNESYSMEIDKPHLLKVAKDGSYKVTGVGEAKVTVKAGEKSQTLTITAKLGKNLTGAVNLNNVTYLPIQTVFQSLGGTVTYTAASKTYDVTIGTTTIQLKVGQKNAKVNGKDTAMEQAVREEKGKALFPASLLSKSLGAKLQWDTKLQQMKVSFGSAFMVIESADTPKIKKQDEQGTLVKYLNKSFWVNSYKNWERFSKVTVTDIVPVGSNNFQVVFKDAKGNTLQSDIMSKDFVSRVLDDSYTFLSYDPYKKYSWSAATWESIKASKISIGMNKTQVEFSWGRPNDISKLTSQQTTIEVWSYGSQYVAFTNGKVTQIYTL